MKLERLQEILATLGKDVSDVEVEVVGWAQSMGTDYLLCRKPREFTSAFHELVTSRDTRDAEQKRQRKRLTNQRRELRRLAKRETALTYKCTMRNRLMSSLERENLLMRHKLNPHWREVGVGAEFESGTLLDLWTSRGRCFEGCVVFSEAESNSDAVPCYVFTLGGSHDTRPGECLRTRLYDGETVTHCRRHTLPEGPAT